MLTYLKGKVLRSPSFQWLPDECFIPSLAISACQVLKICCGEKGVGVDPLNEILVLYNVRFKKFSAEQTSHFHNRVSPTTLLEFVVENRKSCLMPTCFIQRMHGIVNSSIAPSVFLSDLFKAS